MTGGIGQGEEDSGTCAVCNFNLPLHAFAYYNDDRHDNVCMHCVHITVGLCGCGYRWQSTDGEVVDGVSILGPCPVCGETEDGVPVSNIREEYLEITGEEGGFDDFEENYIDEITDDE